MDGSFIAVGSHKGRLYIYNVNDKRVSALLCRGVGIFCQLTWERVVGA